jgi:hypothetical protein
MLRHLRENNEKEKKLVHYSLYKRKWILLRMDFKAGFKRGQR